MDRKPATADEIRQKMKNLGHAAREELRRRGVPEAEIEKTMVPKAPEPPAPERPRLNIKI
jgi:hypothetical protein